MLQSAKLTAVAARRACRRPAGPLELPARLGDGRPHAAAPQRRTLGYTLRELLSLVAYWRPSWPLSCPAGQAQAGRRPKPESSLSVPDPGRPD